MGDSPSHEGSARSGVGVSAPKRVHKNKVRMALARRLLVSVWVMLRTGEAFDMRRCLGMPAFKRLQSRPIRRDQSLRTSTRLPTRMDHENLTVAISPALRIQAILTDFPNEPRRVSSTTRVDRNRTQEASRTNEDQRGVLTCLKRVWFRGLLYGVAFSGGGSEERLHPFVEDLYQDGVQVLVVVWNLERVNRSPSRLRPASGHARVGPARASSTKTASAHSKSDVRRVLRRALA